MEDHQISGHLGRDFNLLGLQLCVHAEQYIMGVTVVPCGRNMQKPTKNTEAFCNDLESVFECHCVIFMCRFPSLSGGGPGVFVPCFMSCRRWLLIVTETDGASFKMAPAEISFMPLFPDSQHDRGFVWADD